MSESKTIISGCGISWSGQERKTWVRILKFIGADILDVGGPAVSNQWIINQSVLSLWNQPVVRRLIIQLTNLGKLDVEVDQARITELVQRDSLRNFVVDGIWPSSSSIEHDSKKLWKQWLFSPRLEIQDLRVKLLLLTEVCQARDIELILVQGYHLPWSEHDAADVMYMVENHHSPLYDQYQTSIRYQFHDHANHNTVPELGWQINLAKTMCQRFWPNLLPRMDRLSQAFDDKNT